MSRSRLDLRQPVDLGDDQYVALAETVEHVVELRPVAMLAGDLLLKDLLAPAAFSSASWVSSDWPVVLTPTAVHSPGCSEDQTRSSSSRLRVGKSTTGEAGTP